MSASGTIALRRANPDEAASLTKLAVRSKRHWGYSDAFMRAAVSDMQVPAEVIAREHAVVAERDGEVAGFYVLAVEAEGPTLRDLWVEPHAIGTGVGAVLWRDMLEAARARGFHVVRIVSDPHAEGFYVKMGARRVGEIASNVEPDRMLGVFESETSLTLRRP